MSPPGLGTFGYLYIDILLFSCEMPIAKIPKHWYNTEPPSETLVQQYNNAVLGKCILIIKSNILRVYEATQHERTAQIAACLYSGNLVIYQGCQ